MNTVSSPDAARLLDRMEPPLSIDDFEWNDAARYPLSAAEVFQLTYAAQVEWGTEGTFRSLDTYRDPLLATFLRTWLDQEVEHARLLCRLLRERGHRVAAIHASPKHRRAAQRARYLNQLAYWLIGADFTALHMAWGALNELTTLRFYQQIRVRTAHPLLADILRALVRQEAMHYRFYYTVARELLDNNPRGQRIVRYALRTFWTPVGVGLRDETDVIRIIHQLFDDDRHILTGIDAAISALPGLDALDLMARIATVTSEGLTTTTSTS